MRHPTMPAFAALALLALAAPALARPGGWGPGWGGGYDRPFPDSSWQRDRTPAGPEEGKVEVSRFVAEGDAATLLGKGIITAEAAPAGAGVDERSLKTYEAAVIDQLAHAGYQTAAPDGSGAQVVELRISHDTLVPEEAPHKPVSGEMTMGMSNHGSMMGLGLAIDLSKPRKALIGTRLEARIRDKASGQVLWEGRADIATCDGRDKWDENAIAARLARALFDGFPGKSGETRISLR